MTDTTLSPQEVEDPGQDYCRVGVTLATVNKSLPHFVVFPRGGRLSASPDRALRAYFLFFDIFKVESAAILKIDTSL